MYCTSIFLNDSYHIKDTEVMFGCVQKMAIKSCLSDKMSVFNDVNSVRVVD